MTALLAPRVRVLLEQDGPGYLEYDVQTDNRDMTQWDAVRARRKWPKAMDAPSLWMTFLTWHALYRTGAGVDAEFDAFNARCVQTQMIDADGNPVRPGTAEGEAAASVDPTQATLDIGSS